MNIRGRILWFTGFDCYKTYYDDIDQLFSSVAGGLLANLSQQSGTQVVEYDGLFVVKTNHRETIVITSTRIDEETIENFLENGNQCDFIFLRHPVRFQKSKLMKLAHGSGFSFVTQQVPQMSKENLLFLLQNKPIGQEYKAQDALSPGEIDEYSNASFLSTKTEIKEAARKVAKTVGKIARDLMVEIIKDIIMGKCQMFTTYF